MDRLKLDLAQAKREAEKFQRDLKVIKMLRAKFKRIKQHETPEKPDDSPVRNANVPTAKQYLTQIFSH
jgi:hypothetical protein